MITLCMDTSHKHLVIALIKENSLVDYVEEICPKQQSEQLFPKMIELLNKNHLKAEDIEAVVISEGPGSYTGVRIAMSVAKVLCASKDIPLYTINTLRLYGGSATGRVVLDARGGRVYTAVYENGKEIEAPNIKEVKEISDENLIGDAHLFGKEDNYPSISKNFLETKNEWKKAENVHTVVPEYYKSIEAYQTK